MGCWMIAKDRIEIHPSVDDDLIRDFIFFEDAGCPEDYCTEKFMNSWFFDSENRLVCVAGKFAEPSVWFKHLRKYFFKPRRYYLPDKIQIIGELDDGFEQIAEEREGEYKLWRKRREKLLENYFKYTPPYYFYEKAGADT